MKSPGEGGLLKDARLEEPRVYVGWYPVRPDVTGLKEPEALTTVPSILIAPTPAKVRAVEERFSDRYDDIYRPKEMGGTFGVSMLFAVYEPGDRLPGFSEHPTPELLIEATEQGLFTLTDWMDELCAHLLAAKTIPGTDLFLREATLERSLYTEMGMLPDKRPIFYGFVNATFGCYSNEAQNGHIKGLLE